MRVPTFPCWACLYPTDACIYVPDPHLKADPESWTRTAPSDGDISICLACGEIGIFVVSGLGMYSMREPTARERAAALEDRQVVGVMLAHREVREQNPNWPRGPRDSPA